MNKKVFLLTKQVDIYLCLYMCNSDFKLKENIQHTTSVGSASMSSTIMDQKYLEKIQNKTKTQILKIQYHNFTQQFF